MAKKIAVSLDLLGNEIKDFVVDARATAPAVKKGKFYFDTTSNALRYHNGTAWITIATGGSTEEIGSRLTTVETNLAALKEAFEAIGDVTDDAHGYMTPAQKKKLDGIAEGANKTTVNNTLTSTSTTDALSAAQGKALDEKITEVSNNAQVVAEGVVSDAIMDLQLDYNSGKKQLSLQNSNGDISTIDVSAFVKDGMISGQALYKATAATGTVTINETAYSLSGLTAGHTYIVLVWNTDAGKDPMTIDVTTLIDVYTAGNGLKLENNQFSVVIDPDSEKFADTSSTPILTVSSKGIKIAGITNAISKAVTTLLGDADTVYNSGNEPTLHSLENLIHETTDQYYKKVTSGTSVVLTPKKEGVDIGGISPSTVRCFYYNGTVEEEVLCDISVNGENVTVSWSGLTVNTTNYLKVYWRESYAENEVA